MYSQAIKPLDRAVELLPDDFESLYMLGISLVESEEYSKAISPLGRARAIKKPIPEFLNSLHCAIENSIRIPL